jgi:hypothetical protein
MSGRRGISALWLLAFANCVFAQDGRANALTAVIFPSGPTVPENLLRIELRFSAPLRLPFTIAQVKLLDNGGREIEHAFLDLPLPSADGTRVTILMDPGRVKSGLIENRTLGRALHGGSTVTLVVDDAELSAPTHKTWWVTGFASQRLRPDRWMLDPPLAGTRDALLLHLRAPLSSTAESLIAIRGPDARRVPGVARLERGETLWRFIPAVPWESAAYSVVTHPELEDTAGNRPCAPFEAVEASRMQCPETIRVFHAVGPREKS